MQETLKDIKYMVVSSPELLDPRSRDIDALFEISLQCKMIRVSGVITEKAFFAPSKTRRLGASLSWDYEINPTPFLKLSENKFWEDFLAALKLYESGVLPQQILHVTTNSDRSLGASAKVGIVGCLVPRNHANGAVEAEMLNVPVIASDLEQLHEGLRRSIGKPVYYEVIANCVHPKIAREFLRWMRDEHALEVLNSPGCFEFHVMRDIENESIVRTQYVFRNQTDYNHYITEISPVLRDKTRSIFSQEMIEFSRSGWSLEVRGQN